MTVQAIQKELRKYATKERAATNAWFFKTGPGQYGAGDKFVGVTVPNVRMVARRNSGTPLSEIALLLQSDIHEDRLTALLILTERYKRVLVPEKKKIVSFYLKHKGRVNNWDLVDTSAANILGAYLYDTDRTILYTLAQSKYLWDRRIAVVATFYFIKRRDFVDIFSLTKLLIKDTEDLIHKALGWMLREVGKQDENALKTFLDEYRLFLPRTTLRYAIERLSPSEKKEYMRK